MKYHVTAYFNDGLCEIRNDEWVRIGPPRFVKPPHPATWVTLVNGRDEPEPAPRRWWQFWKA
jgi:hypothetical protein